VLEVYGLAEEGIDLPDLVRAMNQQAFNPALLLRGQRAVDPAARLLQRGAILGRQRVPRTEGARCLGAREGCHTGRICPFAAR